MLPLGVDRRINQNPEYNRKPRIQSENQNAIGNPEYARNIRIQSENQNAIGKSEYNRKARIQSKNQNTIGNPECNRKTGIHIGKIEQHIRKSKQVKHKNTKTQKKRGMQQMHISSAKITYGEDDRTKKHHQRI